MKAAANDPTEKAQSQKPRCRSSRQRYSNATPRKTSPSNMAISGGYTAGRMMA